MITIIFSKNRSLQLDLLLNSIKENNNENLNIHVLYTYSDEQHEKSYEILAKEHPEATFHKEINFKQDLLDLISQEEYILFICDDAIVTNEFNINEIIELLNYYPEAVGFSLRLGANTNYCYSLNRNQNMPPSIKLKDNILMFSWVGSEADYGYPLEISSSIYKTRDILPTIANMESNNPNKLEWHMSKCAGMFHQMKPLLLCYEESACFCNPINKTNPSNNRSSTNPNFDADLLLTNYLKGGRIKYSSFKNFVSNACHQELPIEIEYKEK